MALLKSIISREHPATSALIVLNALVFLAMAAAGGSTDVVVLVKFGALVHHRVWQGEYWRLVTPMFLHIGLLHFAFNTYALLIVGRAVERLLGTLPFLILYLGSGVCGAIGSLLFTRGICAGASGAIFGLLGALLALEYLASGSLIGLVRYGVRGSVLPIIAINLVLGASVRVIDNNAHIGGLLAGCAFGYYMAARRFMVGPHLKRSAVVLAAFVTACSFGLVRGLRAPVERYGHDRDAGRLILASGHDPQLAVPYLKRAVKANPKDYQTWSLLARAYGLSKPPQYERALEAIRQARRACPRHMQAQELYIALEGHWLEMLGQVEDALAVYTQGLAELPKAADMRSRAIACLLDRLRFKEALDLAKAGLKELPYDVSSYHGIQSASRALGDLEAAQQAHEFIRQHYEKRYQDKPNAFNANNLAWTYAEGNVELDKALHLAKEAVHDQSDSPHSLDTLGWVYFRRGQTDDAIGSLQRVLKLEPKASYAHYHLAEVLAKAGRPQEALAAANKALTIPRVFEERWAAEALVKTLKARLGSPSSGS